MNEYEKQLMQAPSIESEGCAVCGKWQTEEHHIVFRSHGGTTGPVVPLCGFGNTSGCHGLSHQHKLHFKYVFGCDSEDGVGYWEYIITEPMKYEKALQEDGWKRVGHKPYRKPVQSMSKIMDIPI